MSGLYGFGSEQLAAELHRPRHQLHRSSSDMPLGSRHHFRHSHHRGQGSKDEKASGAGSRLGLSINTAAATASGMLDGIKSELGFSSDVSRTISRATSVLNAPTDDKETTSRQEVQIRPPKPVDPKVERELDERYAKEVTKSLEELNTLANTTAHHLDDTYYSVLEKMNALNATISSLKELAQLSRQMKEEFDQESFKIVKDVNAELDGLSNFEEHEKKIQQLETRIAAGRARAYALNLRVEGVKARVEQWEHAEKEWEQQIRKTLRIIWIVTACLIVLILGLLALQYTPLRTTGMGTGVLHGFNASNVTMNITELEDKFRDGSITANLKRATVGALDSLREAVEENLEEDPRLRLFDEL